MSTSMEGEGTRQLGKFHASLVRSTVPFFVVARVTAGSEVFPGGAAATGTRDNVIEGKVRRAARGAAILAGVAVTHQDVLS